MRIFLLISAVLLCISCHRYSPRPMTVVKDCTGTYLRVNGKDYHVCNTEKTDRFSDGQAVTAGFDRIRTCHGAAADDMVCMMVHENEGWIQVRQIE